MKKITAMVIIGLLIAANSWAVVVTGSGVTKEEAINSGLREAVEMYTGALVYGVTDVENYQIKKDQLVASSLGYVKTYRIIKTSNIDNLILITMDVKLSEDKIESIVRENINLITIDDVLKDYNNVTQRQDQIKKLIKMLHTMAKRPVREKYGVIYEGYTIKRISATTVDTILNVRITQNPFYHKAYNEILKNLSEPMDSPGVALVGGDYSILAGQLTSKKYHISNDGVNTTDLYNVEAQVYVNGKPVDQCREYQDNLMVVFSTTKFVTGFIRLFPSEFKKTWNGDETPIDSKYSNFAIRGSKIIPPEGLPLKIKYQIKNSEDIKNLKNLKMAMTRCGGELKQSAEDPNPGPSSLEKKQKKIKARYKQQEEEK